MYILRSKIQITSPIWNNKPINPVQWMINGIAPLNSLDLPQDKMLVNNGWY